MDKFFVASLIALSGLLQAGGFARADAFLEAPGSGKVIVTGGFESSSAYVDAAGDRQPVAAYRKFTLRARTEYGVSERLTLIGGLEAGAVRTPDASLQGAGAIGTRALMFKRESLVISAVTLVTAGKGLDATAYGTDGANADMRMEAGYSFKALGTDAFATLSAGTLMATGGGRERRIDATLGARPRADVLVLLQTFSRFTQRPVAVAAKGRRAAALGQEHGSAHKAQASVVWDVLADWSVQAGVFATLLARNERLQRGIFAALWRRF